MQAAERSATGAEIGSPRVRRALGAAALALTVALLAWPVARSRIAPQQATPALVSTSKGAADRSHPEAQASVAHLQAASAALAEAANEVLTSRSAARSTGAETEQCVESLVPPGTFGAGRLDWVCEQADVWQLQLDLYGRVVSRGSGRGVPLWVRLGPFELGAIAILRAACCPNAPPLVAPVSTDRCGSLEEALGALGEEPSPEQVEQYADVMECLASRKVWLPEAWAQVGPRESRRVFERLLEGTRTAPPD